MSAAARSRRYADANREKVRAARRASYAKNPAVELTSSKVWKKNNTVRVNANRRSAYADVERKALNMTLKEQLEAAWNRPDVAYACRFTKWRQEDGRVRSEPGRLTFPKHARTK